MNGFLMVDGMKLFTVRIIAVIAVSWHPLFRSTVCSKDNLTVFLVKRLTRPYNGEGYANVFVRNVNHCLALFVLPRPFYKSIDCLSAKTKKMTADYLRESMFNG